MKKTGLFLILHCLFISVFADFKTIDEFEVLKQIAQIYQSPSEEKTHTSFLYSLPKPAQSSTLISGSTYQEGRKCEMSIMCLTPENCNVNVLIDESEVYYINFQKNHQSQFQILKRDQFVILRPGGQTRKSKSLVSLLAANDSFIYVINGPDGKKSQSKYCKTTPSLFSYL